MSWLQKITGTAINRPDSISVMCILLALWSIARLLYFALAFVGAAEMISFIGLILSLSILISLSALWRMRLWGVHLFLATMAINIVLLQLVPADLSIKGAIRMGGTVFLVIIYMIIVMPHKKSLVSRDQP